MYTYTPTHRFLVLAPIQSGPISLPTDRPQTKVQPDSPQLRDRSDSQSSTTSSGTQLGGDLSRIHSGFLYLGHDTSTPSSPSA